jgi:hypothetical protein
MSGFLHWSYLPDYNGFRVWDDSGEMKLSAELIAEMNQFLVYGTNFIRKKLENCGEYQVGKGACPLPLGHSGEHQYVWDLNVIWRPRPSKPSVEVDRIERLEKIMDGVIAQIYHGIKENPDTQNWFKLIEEYRRTGAVQSSHE